MFSKWFINIFKVNKLNINEVRVNVTRNKLQELGRKYMNAVSEDVDIIKWEIYLDILNEELNLNPCNNLLNAIIYEFNELFLEYLLKHHPKDYRLKLRYGDFENILEARKCIYRKMTLIALGETLFITHRWEFENKTNYKHFKSFINEYVYYLGKRKSFLCETKKCMNLDEKSIELLLNKAKKYVLDYTEEQRIWHKKVENLKSFYCC